MELMIQAVVQALTAAGIHAAAALPVQVLPHLEAPAVAVGLQSAQASACALYDYLGVETGEDGSWREIYGRRLEATLSLEVYCPAALGGAGARAAAEAVAQVLLDGVEGLRLGTFTVGACAYDADSALFVCPCTAEAAAYVYATVADDGETFTDFILKGVLK